MYSFFSFPLLLVVDRNNQTDWFHKFILQEVEFTFYIQYQDTGFQNREPFFYVMFNVRYLFIPKLKGEGSSAVWD